MELLNHINELLADRKMTAKELTERLGLGRTTINDWRRGKSTPSPTALIGISQIFNVSIDWILTGEGERHKINHSTLPTSDEQRQKILSLEERLLLSHYNDIPDNKKLEIQKNAARVALEAETFNANNSTPNQSETPGSVSKKKIPVRVYDLPASAGFGNYLGDEEPYEILPFAVDQVPPETEFGVRISGDSMYPKIKDGSVAWIKQQIAIENEDIGIFILDGLAYCKQLIIYYEKRVIKLVSINSNYPPLIINENNDLRTIGKVLGSSFF